MDVKLKNERKVTYEDFNDGEIKTITFKKDLYVPVTIVTKWFVREFENFEPYLNKFYIDINKLQLPSHCILQDISELIVEDGEYYDADILGALDEVSKKLGITDEEFDEYRKLSHQERMDRLDVIIAKLDK